MKTTILTVMPAGPELAEQAYELMESLPDSEKNVIVGMCYLHGQLDYDMQDLFFPINAVELGLVKDKVISSTITIPALFVNGIIPVKVVTTDKPCIGFFWVIEEESYWRQRGLICYEDDVEACKYAKQKMIENSDHL